MIVVVGAGLIGLGIAYELAKRGAEVRVVEAGAPAPRRRHGPAPACSRRTPSIRTTPSSPLSARVRWTLYPAYVEELRVERRASTRACGSTGSSKRPRASRTPSVLRARVDGLARRGVAARWLTAAEVRDRSRRSPRRTARRLIEAEGQVDNRRLGRALEAACLARGVVVRDRTRTGRARGRLAPGARNSLAGRFSAGRRPSSTRRVRGPGELAGVPARRCAFRFVRSKARCSRWPHRAAWSSACLWFPGVYLVPREDGRLAGRRDRGRGGVRRARNSARPAAAARRGARRRSAPWRVDRQRVVGRPASGLARRQAVPRPDQRSADTS